MQRERIERQPKRFVARIRRVAAIAAAVCADGVVTDRPADRRRPG
jgi:hypothetical protein